MMVAGLFSTTSRQVSAQEDRWGGRNPVIILLDGIQFWGSLPWTQANPPRDYFAVDLMTAWGIKGHLLRSVQWDGDLRNLDGVLSYFSKAKATIREEITSSAHRDRPIVVIAHSWGGITVYLALSELQTESE
jgi:hypothetical protein